MLPNLQQPILIVAPFRRTNETIKRLARIGVDNVLGYLKGSFDTWKIEGKEIDTIETINAKDFENRYKNNQLTILDVRKPGEFEAEHLENAQNFPLDYINRSMHEVNQDKEYYMHCRSGYRSTVAASILKSRGFDKIVNIQDLFDTMAKSSIPTTAFVCPSEA